jgi:hypothetical protein
MGGGGGGGKLCRYIIYDVYEIMNLSIAFQNLGMCVSNSLFIFKDSIDDH